MTVSNALALLGAMVVLAAIPSVSVLTVCTRSAALGWWHGVWTTIGIVVGDIVFILVAIWGLSVLAEMDQLFTVLKYLGVGYLLVLGVRLCASKPLEMATAQVNRSSLFSSFLAGLLITLADQKAVLFYLGFFPAFLDLTRLTHLDTVMIVAIAIVAVGGVKLIYAGMANRARVRFSVRITKWINLGAGCLLIAVAIKLSGVF
jgi:threonine/homoserine/homoserine lactone efflux protein